MEMIHIFSVHSIAKRKNQGEHFQRMYKCYSSAGRSVLEKNCTRGFGSALKTEGTVFPNTDEAKLVYNIFYFFFSGNLKECLQKEPK